MITDADIKKLKEVFATKDELNQGHVEIIAFIGEVKEDIMKEFADSREEVRAINCKHNSILDNHESRIAHLEYKT